MSKWRSIKSKLMFWFLLVASVPLLAFGFISYQIAYMELVEKERETALRQVQTTAAVVYAWLDRRMSEIRLAAQTDILQSFDPNRMNRFIHQIAKQSNVYEEIGIAGVDGIVRVNTNPASLGVNISDRSYFQKSVQGIPYLSEVIVSKSSGHRVVSMAAPIEDSSGDVCGIIYAAMNFEALINEFLAQNTNQMEHMVILVDAQDRIQHATNQELIGLTLSETGFNQEALEILVKGKQETGTDFYSLDGEKYLAAYTPIPGTGYALYFSYPMHEVVAGAHTIGKYMAVTIAVVALLVALLAYQVSTAIAKPIRLLTGQVKQIAQGDLRNDTININSQDEIGELSHHMQKMTLSLRTLIRKIADASQAIASSSQQLNASAEETSKATEQISLSTEQIASGAAQQAQNTNDSLQIVQQMSEEIAGITVNSQHVTKLSNETVATAAEGNQAIEESIKQMKQIETKTRVTADTINTLSSKSTQIQNIIAAITAISEQTNLLALNAAIEAARAGEHGHGFAVVAEEVRKLAEQSSQAAEQIRHIIEEVQLDIQRSAESMQQGAMAVQKGSQLTEQAGAAFQKIAAAIGTVYRELQQMSSAVQQLDQNSRYMITAIESVRHIAQDFSANSQHVAAAAEEQNASMEEILASSQMLAQLADELQDAIHVFKF